MKLTPRESLVVIRIASSPFFSFVATNNSIIIRMYQRFIYNFGKRRNMLFLGHFWPLLRCVTILSIGRIDLSLKPKYYTKLVLISYALGSAVIRSGADAINESRNVCSIGPWCKYTSCKSYKRCCGFWLTKLDDYFWAILSHVWGEQHL